jgi:flagellar motor switch protein FliM
VSQRTANAVLSGTGQEIQSYDFQQAGRLSEAQIQALAGLHEGLIRNLSYALGNYLRVSCQLKFKGIEESPFSHFVSQLPAACYIGSIQLQPQHTMGGIQLDLSLAFPMLELLLGGPGTPHLLERGLSEIEEHLMQDALRLICAELEKSWSALDTTVSPREHASTAQLKRLLPPDEKVVVLRLEAGIQESRGVLSIFFPVSIAGALLRKVAKPALLPASAALPPSGHKMQERLLDCPCQVELRVPGVKVSMQDVLYLTPGKVLHLGIPANTSAHLCLEGQEWFTAVPVRVGAFRGAKLGSLLRTHSEPRTKS